jgi:hypothetical protein
VRLLGIALAIAHTVALGLALLFAWFVSSFPWESLTPEAESEFDRAAFLIAGALVSAAVTAIAIALRNAFWAILAFVAQLTLAFAALAIALAHSDHSDGRLVLFALCVEAAGAGAVVLSARRAPRHA